MEIIRFYRNVAKNLHIDNMRKMNRFENKVILEMSYLLF